MKHDCKIAPEDARDNLRVLEAPPRGSGQAWWNYLEATATNVRTIARVIHFCPWCGDDLPKEWQP